MRAVPLNTFYERTLSAKRIVVPDLGFLGDTVHLVPALWEIKQHYPDAEIHVLSSPLGAEVLRLAPCVDRIWPVEIDPARRSWGEQWRVLQSLRRLRFDVAFNFGGNDRTTILTGLTGARWRVAHAAGRSHFWNQWFIPNWVPRQDTNVTVFEQRRQALAACGFKLSTPRFDLKVSDESVRQAAAIVPTGAIHVSTNSANPLKEWPIEHYVTLLQSLWRQRPDLPVVASAGRGERERTRLQVFASGLNDARLHLLSPDLSIAQLAGVLTRCRLHFGPDSGVMNLAMGLGVPTVSYFREQGAYRSWLPVGDQHRVVHVACLCVDHVDAPCEKTGRPACLAGIEPNRVAALIGDALDCATKSSR